MTVQWQVTGYLFTDPDQGANDALDSDANPATGQTGTFTLVRGQTDLTRDAGVYQLGSISGTVLEDTDGDDDGDVPISGSTVNLYRDVNNNGVIDGNDSLVGSDTSDGSGDYSFSNLRPGDYLVEQINVAGFFDVTDADGNANGASLIDVALTSGENETDRDFIDELAKPSLNIVKEASVPGGTADVAGEQISYTITVANTGNVALTGVTVTDPYADPGSLVRGADVVGDNDAVLEVGETWGYTATHTVTQAELDSNGGGDGKLENTATADSNETGPDSDDATVDVVNRQPGIDVEKEGRFANVVGGIYADVGDKLIYTFTVTNTGNVTLTDIVLTDENPYVVFLDDTTIDSLAPGDSVVVRGELTLELGNVLIGSKPNNAIVTATDGEITVSDSDAVLTILPRPANVNLQGSNGNNVIYGGAGLDTLSGLGGNDTINGLGGNDTIYGGIGNDIANGAGGNDSINGDAGNDSITGGDGNDTASGGTGDDTVRGQVGDDQVNGNDGNDQLFGDGGNDTLNGGNQNDVLRGGGNDDRLNGNAGDDTIYGDSGNDILSGGSGVDSLFGGGGNDIFKFAPGESAIGNADVIADFAGIGATAVDRIDLSLFDANTATGGDEAFLNTLLFRGSFGAFTSVRQLQIVDSGADARIFGNTDGNFATAEFEILVKNVNHLAFLASDFVL